VVASKKMSSTEADAFFARIQAPKKAAAAAPEKKKQVTKQNADALFDRLTDPGTKHSLHKEDPASPPRTMTPKEVVAMEMLRQEAERKTMVAQQRARRQQLPQTARPKSATNFPEATDSVTARFYEQERQRQGRLQKLRDEREAELKQETAQHKPKHKMSEEEREEWRTKRLEHEAAKRAKQEEDLFTDEVRRSRPAHEVIAEEEEKRRSKVAALSSKSRWRLQADHEREMQAKARPKRVQGEKVEGPLPSANDAFVDRLYKQEEARRARIEKQRNDEKAAKESTLPKPKKMSEAEREEWRRKRLEHDQERRQRFEKEHEEGEVSNNRGAKKMSESDMASFRQRLLDQAETRKNKLEQLKKDKEDSVVTPKTVYKTQAELDDILQRQMMAEQARQEKIEAAQKEKQDREKEDHSRTTAKKVSEEHILAKAESMMKQEETRRQKLAEARQAKAEEEIAAHGTHKISGADAEAASKRLYGAAMNSIQAAAEAREAKNATVSEAVNIATNNRKMTDSEALASGARLYESGRKQTAVKAEELPEGRPRVFP